ncbi:MAG TPA: fibronectin type III domain-containing protein [Candidatus Angelobacter sp.]|nr:fibronectin type III domain-containing protein [Candidatus Angelobacter sp.]
MRFSITIIILLALMPSLGCGVPGAPQPPSTGIPKFVGDLKALRKGDTVTLTWTTPTETSDGELIRKPGTMLVRRALIATPEAEPNFQTISELPLAPTLKDDRGAEATARDSLAELLRSTPARPGSPGSGGSAEYAVYSVMAQSRSGKSFGLPNRVSVPLVLTLPAPPKVQLEPIPAGIRVGWEQAWPPAGESRLGAQYVWRILRKQEGAADAVMLRQLPAGHEAMVFVDAGIEWEKNYQYWIVPVTLWRDGSRHGEVEGDDSPMASIFAHDSFPPATPSGVQAVYSAAPERSFIDITWTPNIDPDLAGYNVYRRMAKEAPVRINSELVKTPRFADPGVQPGIKYFYSVAAVDLRGNESGRSEETSEAVPKE